MNPMSEAARRSPLFAELGKVELQDVASLAKSVSLAKGETVFEEGDDADALYVVDSGSLRILKTVEESGTRRTIATLEPGDVLGEMALLVEGERTATALAAEDVRLLRIDREGFVELLDSGQPAAFKVLLGLARLLCRRLAKVDALLAQSKQQAGEITHSGWVDLQRLRQVVSGQPPKP